MHLAPPSRRALGLAAAGALVFGFTAIGSVGVAQATPAPSFTASGSGTTAAVPAGICAVRWQLTGGSGGADSGSNAGNNGGTLDVTVPAAAGDTFTLYPGTQGAAGVADGSAAAHGTNGYTVSPSTAGTAGGTDGSGGGGAASVVTKGTGLAALAFGGDGAGTTPGTGGGLGTNLAPHALDSFDESAVASGSGDGTITGTGVLCKPSTPYLDYVESGDGELIVDFDDAGDGDVPAVSYEYTLDGSTWQPLTTEDEGDGWFEGDITGLTNGTRYSVQIRGVAANTGVSDPSNSEDGTPMRVASAPGNVTATAGPASLTVHWTASTPGDFPIAGYEVMSVWSNGESGGADEICHTTATVLGCTGAAQPGKQHRLVVVAVDTQDNLGQWAELTTPTVPFPADPPTSNGNLTPASGTTTSAVQPGSTITVSGSGYEPGSTVTVLIYSSPQVLTTVVADGSGNFTVTVTVPSGLAPGQHTLVASGVDNSGNLRYVTLPVTVVSAANGSPKLAYTGFDLALPLTGGLLALGVGGGLMVASRRRKAADPAA